MCFKPVSVQVITEEITFQFWEKQKNLAQAKTFYPKYILLVGMFFLDLDNRVVFRTTSNILGDAFCENS